MAWAYNTQEGTPNNGSMIASIALAVTALSLVALCLRIYVRTRIAKAMGLDDWLIMAAWIGACGYASAIVVQTKWGLGLTSLNDMPDQNVVPFGFYVGAPFYVLGIWGFKTSLLVSYVRLVPGAYRLVPILLAVMITMAHIAFLLVFLLLCIPVQKQWIPTTPGQCGQAVPFYITFSSLTIIFDVITLALPFPILVKLQMKLRRKMALLCLFALGIFVTIVQIIRIQTITSLSNYLDSAEAIKWSIVETNVGIFITCVPTLAPLVRYFSEKTRSGGSSGNTPARPGGDGGFALQSWRVTKNGMRPLGSGVDRENEGEKSTENILQGPVASVSEASEASDGPGSHERAPASASASASAAARRRVD